MAVLAFDQPLSYLPYTLMARSDKPPNARLHEPTNKPRTITADVTPGAGSVAVTGQPLIAFEIHGFRFV
jgi:hypothetical protein